MILRDYQEQAVKKALEKISLQKPVYLAFETRCGKTITALSIASRINARAVLFLTKKKAITSIQSDFDKSGFVFDFTVTNYEQAKKIKPVFDCVIIDEAHNFGAFPKPSLRTKQVKTLCKGIPVIFLSATPTPESYSQIFHQLWLSDYSPFKHKTFYKFAADFINVKKKKINAVQEINDYSETKPELQPILNDLFITITQQQAGFTQEIKEVFHNVSMSQRTKDFFKSMRKCRVIADPQVTADTAGKLLTKCHQIASGTVITDSGEYKILDLSKIKYVFEHFPNSWKIAIFYKFKSELDMIISESTKECCAITNNPEEFNTTGHAVIYAGQIQSAREGVDLRSADALIMLNIDFAAVSYFQAINRLQTQKRDKPAVIHWIFSDLGLEQKIYKTVGIKRNYTGSIFLKQFKEVKNV